MASDVRLNHGGTAMKQKLTSAQTKTLISLVCIVLIFGGNLLINRFLPEYRFNPIGMLKETAVQTPEKETSLDVTAAIESKAKAVLLGTIVNRSTAKNKALIDGAWVEEGQRLLSGLTLVEVSRFRIFVRAPNSKQLEFIIIGEFDAELSPMNKDIMQIEASTFHVHRESIDRVTADLRSFLNDANASIQASAPDVSGGMKLNYIRAGGVYDSLGLTVDDEIIEVNGYALNSEQAKLRLYQQLRLSSLIELEIRRSGKRKKVTYYVR